MTSPVTRIRLSGETPNNSHPFHREAVDTTEPRVKRRSRATLGGGAPNGLNANGVPQQCDELAPPFVPHESMNNTELGEQLHEFGFDPDVWRRSMFFDGIIIVIGVGLFGISCYDWLNGGAFHGLLLLLGLAIAAGGWRVLSQHRPWLLSLAIHENGFWIALFVKCLSDTVALISR